jgi:hypothetical protein
MRAPVYPRGASSGSRGFIFFQPIGRICFIDNVGARQYGLLRHSNPSAFRTL